MCISILRQDKARSGVLLRESLKVQFLNCGSSRFKVVQLTSSQTGVMFVKKEGASRFLTLLNVEIRRIAESAETQGDCQAGLAESSDTGSFFTHLLHSYFTKSVTNTLVSKNVICTMNQIHKCGLIIHRVIIIKGCVC